MKSIHFLTITVTLLISTVSLAADKSTIGATEVAKWQDDKKACFMLMFDDSWPSHFQVAVPELVKRKMTATFYINPGKGEYKAKKDQWEGEKAVWKQGMVYGNHTMTHNGMQDLKDAEWEIRECNKVILNTVPGKQRRLISWGRPGVKDWKISKEETQALLDKNLLISRPPFRDHGVVYHLKTADEMLALADKAIKDGDMEYLIAHGVERGPEMNWGYQDFWAWNQKIFKTVLDGVAERRDRGDLWVTDHISYHKYKSERNEAQIKILNADKEQIKLKLTTKLDPELYDYPLTLKTRVPGTWKECQIKQKDLSCAVMVKNSIVQFNANPNNSEIVITCQKLTD